MYVYLDCNRGYLGPWGYILFRFLFDWNNGESKQRENEMGTRRMLGCIGIECRALNDWNDAGPSLV